MRSICAVLEGLLDTDFDIKDNDVVTTNLCDVLAGFRRCSYDVAEKRILKIMSGVPEISPMKRQTLANNSTIITIYNNNGIGHLSIVYRGGKACFSHVSFEWLGSRAEASFLSKGIGNLATYKNKRKTPNMHCWMLPAESFDTIYNLLTK